jgi:hypothetical protein
MTKADFLRLICTSIHYSFAVALLLAQSSTRAEGWQPSAGHIQAPIWPGAVPDAIPNPKPESVGPPEGREWWPRAVDTRDGIDPASGHRRPPRHAPDLPASSPRRSCRPRKAFVDLVRRATEGRRPYRNALVRAGRSRLRSAAEQTADRAMAAAGGNMVGYYWWLTRPSDANASQP